MKLEKIDKIVAIYIALFKGTLFFLGKLELPSDYYLFLYLALSKDKF